MKIKALMILLMCAVLMFTAACSSNNQKNDADSGSASSDTAGNSANGSKTDGKSIVIYFSRVGNTDFPADVDALTSASIRIDNGTVKGNAQLMAEYIAAEAGCETYEITVEEPYPVDYDETVNLAREEQNKNARPALKNDTINTDEYDTVYLVFPNWWADLPMPLYTFFENHDFSSKTINVFATHEGSGFSKTVDAVKKLEPKADVNEGLAVRGANVTDEEQSIRKWVKDN